MQLGSKALGGYYGHAATSVQCLVKSPCITLWTTRPSKFDTQAMSTASAEREQPSPQYGATIARLDRAAGTLAAQPGGMKTSITAKNVRHHSCGSASSQDHQRADKRAWTPDFAGTLSFSPSALPSPFCAVSPEEMGGLGVNRLHFDPLCLCRFEGR